MHNTIFICSLLATIHTIFSFPVIIDTDIGQYMDDSWAISLSLKMTNMDLKMILTAAHNTVGRAQIVAKFLTAVGHDQIPIGIGIVQDDIVGPLYTWAKDFNLTTYKGGVWQDGIAKAIDIIAQSPEPITILEIAPVGNIQELLKQRPDLASKMIIKAMSGSIQTCYDGVPVACPEYNVDENIPASQIVYATLWNQPMVIAPIDVGWKAVIEGEIYQQLLKAQKGDILVQTLIENYQYWYTHGGGGHNTPANGSTELWDPVAAYMTFTEPTLLGFNTIPMIVTNGGLTAQNRSGMNVKVAMSWIAGGPSQWADVVVGVLVSKTTIYSSDTTKN